MRPASLRSLFSLFVIIGILTAGTGGLTQDATGSAPEPEPDPTYHPRHVVVGLAEHRDAAQLAASIHAHGGRLVNVLEPIGVAVIDTPDPERFIERAHQSGAFRYAERDPYLAPLQTPNDLDYERQWGMGAIRAPETWPHSQGAGVIVAIMDSGVRWIHPDLIANTWVNSAEIPGNLIDDDGNGYVDDVIGWDFIDNDANPDPGDCSGHGTHVAGIVGATQNNLIGVTGAAPSATLMPLRMICQHTTASVATAALLYAADNGAQVIQGSWLIRAPSEAYADASRYAYDHGAVLVQAAGNAGSQGVSYPASLPEYIAVGAIASDLTAPGWSSRGAKVELAAPGNIIYSTYTVPLVAPMSGTSMAAPHVSGVAALLLAHEPGLSNTEVRDRLAQTSLDLGPPGRDEAYGHGLIDAAAALGLA